MAIKYETVKTHESNVKIINTSSKMCLTFVCLLPPQKGATAVQQECARTRLCLTMMSQKNPNGRVKNVGSTLTLRPLAFDN